MTEILGIGMTHNPGLAWKDESPGSHRVEMILKDRALPEHLRDLNNLSEGMQQEYRLNHDGTSARIHREKVAQQFHQARKKIDEFSPDFIVMFGDDQYENYKDDLVPAFSILAYEEFSFRPYCAYPSIRPNFWDEPEDKLFRVPGHKAAGKFLASSLIRNGFDMAYAYQPLHSQEENQGVDENGQPLTGLGHAFANAVLFLDYDRKGFKHPIVPVTVNCYGDLLSHYGTPFPTPSMPIKEEFLDPESPEPSRCYDLGARIARSLKDSPFERVALMASSSWSHASLTRENYYLYPDVPADLELYDAMIEGRYDVWRNRSAKQIKASGQREMLNWVCLMGAINELGQRVDESSFVTSYIFNSDKIYAAFPPNS
jgi:hypothetical protein